ncbi:probable mRNA decay activator protein ZFP36L1 at N-terminal half [Coccomyxa sp. Obi]|nr:probable mRNA decay activator protein ZFP36L1 at N-terminal half [Coccomyxa sp. Obi]
MTDPVSASLVSPSSSLRKVASDPVLQGKPVVQPMYGNVESVFNKLAAASAAMKLPPTSSLAPASSPFVGASNAPIEPLLRSLLPGGAGNGHLASAPSNGSSTSSSNQSSSKNMPNSLYKTELCRSWRESGSCRYGSKCQFAHGHKELRPVQRHPKYRTEPCRTFATTGACPYGSRCRFIHNDGSQSTSSLMDTAKSSLGTYAMDKAYSTPASFGSALAVTEGCLFGALKTPAVQDADLRSNQFPLQTAGAWDGCGFEWTMANGQTAAGWQPEHMLASNGCVDMRAITGHTAHMDGGLQLLDPVSAAILIQFLQQMPLSPVTCGNMPAMYMGKINGALPPQYVAYNGTEDKASVHHCAGACQCMFTEQECSRDQFVLDTGVGTVGATTNL